MCRRIFILCCVFFIAISQSGCIGLIVNTPGECKIETPFTGIHDIFWDKGTVPKTSTKADFLKEWGKPDEINSTSENEETWIYKRKIWCGVMPVLILPVPLILPVCDGFDRIKFKDNKATRLHTRSIVWGGGIALLTPFGVGGGSGGKDPDCRFPRPYGPVYSKVDKILDNTGLVYFYWLRDDFRDERVSLNIKTGETVITTLYHNGYHPYFSSPGELEFWVDNEKDSSVKIDVKPGQTYYIKAELVTGFFSRRPQLKVVDSEDAENEIAGCKLMLLPD